MYFFRSFSRFFGVIQILALDSNWLALVVCTRVIVCACVCFRMRQNRKKTSAIKFLCVFIFFANLLLYRLPCVCVSFVYFVSQEFVAFSLFLSVGLVCLLASFVFEKKRFFLLSFRSKNKTKGISLSVFEMGNRL